jgi:hypothetical protein
MQQPAPSSANPAPPLHYGPRLPGVTNSTPRPAAALQPSKERRLTPSVSSKSSAGLTEGSSFRCMVTPRELGVAQQQEIPGRQRPPGPQSASVVQRKPQLQRQVRRLAAEGSGKRSSPAAVSSGAGTGVRAGSGASASARQASGQAETAATGTGGASAQTGKTANTSEKARAIRALRMKTPPRGSSARTTRAVGVASTTKACRTRALTSRGERASRNRDRPAARRAAFKG